VLIGKLAHPAEERRKKKRGPRQATYSREVQTALIKVWEGVCDIKVSHWRISIFSPSVLAYVIR